MTPLSRLLSFILLTSFACILWCPSTLAGDGLPIRCMVEENGELEVWKEENGENVAVGVGGVTVIRGEYQLQADRIVLWSGKVNHCYAEGNVRLTEPGHEMSGDALVYDLDAKKGQFVSPHMRTSGGILNWFVGGPDVKQTSPKVVEGTDAWISTCGFEEPHYRFQAKKVILHVDQKIEAWHAIFFWGKIPLFYFPYIYRDLQHEWPWTQYEVGKSTEWGAYFLGKIGFDITPNVWLVTGADYREQWGWGWPMIVDYHKNDRYTGLIDLYYTDEWSRHPEPDRIYAGDVRWRVKAQHRHQLPDPWTLDLEYEDYSDDIFKRDYFSNEYNIGKDPESYAYVRGAWEDSALTGLYRQKTTPFLDQTEYLPQVTYQLMSRPIFSNWASLSTDVEMADLRRNYNHNLDQENPSSLRMDSLTEIHVPFELTRFLELDTFCGTRQSWYEKADTNEETLDDESFWRSAGIVGGGLSTMLWKSFDARNDFMRIDGIRHVIIPRVTYTNVTDPTSTGGDPFIFDETDELAESEAVNVSLVNRFQSEKGGIRDFLYLKAEADYFPRDSHAQREGHEENWSDIEGTLHMLPHPMLSISDSVTFDSHEKDILSGTVSAVFNPSARSTAVSHDIGGSVSLSEMTNDVRGVKEIPAGWFVGYQNSYVRDSYSTNTITAGGRLSYKWYLQGSISSEAMENDWKERSVSLRRSMHRWTMEIAYERADNEDDDFFFLAFYPEGMTRGLITFRRKMTEWAKDKRQPEY